ncbi:MAG: hypothetical protein NC390_00450 [Fusobacterium sp.]|nr:hypothetical protein [Fusobacterium sp.]MCM1053815.1 hypothetical protein [Ruminococcus sp.]
MVNVDYRNELIEVITPVRLNAYGNSDTDLLLNRYIYNLKLSEAFYPALSILEITLRNKICNAIEKFICKDWLLKELNQQNILADKEYKKLLESANKIKKSNKKITNDRLISEMTLGFWVHLCTKSYRPKLWDKKGFFETVFPNYSNNGVLRTIAPIQNDLLAILRLRNRIFHNEIIINGNKTPREQYQLVLNMLHLLSAGMECLLNDISRVEAIIKQKP